MEPSAKVLSVDLLKLPEKIRKAVAKTWDFHGCTAPGVLIGCCMVQKSIDLLGFPSPGIKYNAVAETRVCLVDCIQVMTGCTVGNKYLKVRDTIGRYAFSLYDRSNGLGLRTSLDFSKLNKNRTPHLHRFHSRTRDIETRESKRMEDGINTMNEFIHEFIREWESLLTLTPVKVVYPPKEPREEVEKCRDCGELYLLYPPPIIQKPGTCHYCSLDVPYFIPASSPGGSNPQIPEGK